MLRTLTLFALPALIALAAPAAAQQGGFVPKPDTYICPNATGTGAVDCFLDAVDHLYTMCRHVKSIEIIEFGYEKSEVGVNGAKSEYCVDKQKLNITRPYQAALREATGSRTAVDNLRALYDLWMQAIVSLKWQRGEDDETYKARVAKPYDAFHQQASAVRSALAGSLTNVSSTAAPAAVPAKGSGKR
jgi:hypothetical protein